MKLSPDSVSSLRRNVSSYQPGQAILHQDKSSEVFGSLRSGWAIAYKMLPGGRRHIQGFMVPGDTVVLDLLHIGSNPISFGVSALTKATVCWFNAASIKRLLQGDGVQKAETEFWMAYYFGGLNHRAAMIGHTEAPGRLAEFILELVGRLRYRGLAKSDGYEFPPTQLQVADCLGLTPAYVSMTLTSLRKRGVLEIRDRTLRIFNEHELIQIANEKKQSSRNFGADKSTGRPSQSPK